LVVGLASCDRGQAPTPNGLDLPAIDLGVDSVLDQRATSDAEFQAAFDRRDTNLQVLARGTVSRLLADDTTGDRHQRFILRLGSGQTLLVAHNIDISTRVAGLTVGKIAYAYGEYEWNSEGGVVHWTHRDPDGNHLPGWIQYMGAIYQ
jgi:hypothetical protein